MQTGLTEHGAAPSICIYSCMRTRADCVIRVKVRACVHLPRSATAEAKAGVHLIALATLDARARGKRWQQQHDRNRHRQTPARCDIAASHTYCEICASLRCMSDACPVAAERAVVCTQLQRRWGILTAFLNIECWQMAKTGNSKLMGP
eukprot:794250-Pleurochrysis_carterae.AAC.1